MTPKLSRSLAMATGQKDSLLIQVASSALKTLNTKSGGEEVR